MTRISGLLNGENIEFKSIKDMRSYPFKPEDKIFLMSFGNAGMPAIRCYEDVMNVVQFKKDRYGNPINTGRKDKLTHHFIHKNKCKECGKIFYDRGEICRDCTQNANRTN